MRTITSRLLTTAFCAASVACFHSVPSCFAAPAGQQNQQAAAGSGAVSRRVGAIKAISGTEITLTPDSGADVKITVQPATRIMRVAPGEKDLKNATPIQLQDLQVGDRILVAGKAGDDNSVAASTVVVMKHSDVQALHQQELQDWQKRGVGGVVSAVDPSAGTVTISATAFSGKKTVVIHISKGTVIRRYAPDSVKFDDAKTSALPEIQPGDQVRARGDRNADGTELMAEEIVSGTFRNIAGTVNSVDASSSTLSVHDLLSNKTVLVKITADSQLRHFPPEVAQRFAMRLKGAALGGAHSASSNSGPGMGDQAANAQTPNTQNTSAQAAHPEGPAGGAADGSGAAAHTGGAPDFQQMLSRLPEAPLADLHKGDAVIILSTEGTGGVGTTITLLSGVEPILQAAPSASSAALLTPWTMSAPAGDAGGP
jgi:co-chaperonin GroES (HSP10)